MEARGRILLGVLMLVLATGLGGCQSKNPDWLFHDADLGQAYNPHGDYATAALPSNYTGALGIPTGVEADAWDNTRNDAQLTVQEGYRSAILDGQVTLTRDQQYISNGRVRDNYNQRTYRTTVQESRR